jgi:hypothetical protein
MVTEAKRRVIVWLKKYTSPVLLIFPLLAVLFNYAIANERRQTIQDQKDIHFAEQISELRERLGKSYERLEQLLESQRKENREEYLMIIKRIDGIKN